MVFTTVAVATKAVALHQLGDLVPGLGWASEKKKPSPFSEQRNLGDSPKLIRNLSICLSICLSIYLFIYLSICLSILLFIYLAMFSIDLFIYVSIDLHLI